MPVKYQVFQSPEPKRVKMTEKDCPDAPIKKRKIQKSPLSRFVTSENGVMRKLDF